MEVPVPVTDPAVIEAIEAEFMLTVYEAALLAARRMMGTAEPPPEHPRRPAGSQLAPDLLDALRAAL